MRSPAKARRPNRARGRRTTAAFRFRLFGTLTVERNGTSFALPPARVHGLLAALLLHPGPQSREHLAIRLFPDVPEEAGRRRLSDLLWWLRRALPGLALEIDAQTIELPANARRLDVDEFRAAAAGPDLRDWQAALALYAGDLLEGLYDDWLLEEREALRLEHVGLLQRVCNALIARRQFADALPVAERLVQDEPYDEQALGGFMQILRALGRRGAALAAYERFVALAADELATAPEPATQALARALRSADYAPRLDAVPVLPAEGTPAGLLRHAQEALARGDRAVVDACRRELRSLPRGRGEPEAILIDVDVALFDEQYARAEELLATGEAPAPAMQARAAQLALERHDTQAAYDTALGALARAQAARDRQSELAALLVLAVAQRLLGRSLQAGRTIEQALNLARALESPLHVARALALKAHALVRQGNYAQALTLFHEASALAHQHGLSFNLAEALHGIGAIHTDRGELHAALNTQLEELSLWRDLSLRGREAEALHALSYTYARLGRNTEALRPLEQAREIYLEIGDPVRLAMNDYHLGAGLCYLDDGEAPRAIVILRGAAAVFRAHQQTGWEASTLRTLGYALWVAGRHAEALSSLRDAYDLHARLEEFGMLPETLAYQGLAFLGLGGAGNAAAALDCTRRAMLALAQGEVSDEVVAEIRYAHAMALAANGDESAALAELQCAYESLLAVAAQLEDEPARQAFFEHNPTTRRLMRELHARGLAPEPAAGIVARELPAARGGAPVPVNWTLDAGPADDAIKQGRGAIALRRARLARLLSQAAAQGANPTVAHLAEALGVSERTVQRDLRTVRDP